MSPAATSSAAVATRHPAGGGHTTRTSAPRGSLSLRETASLYEGTGW